MKNRHEIDTGATEVSKHHGYDPLGWKGIYDIKLVEFMANNGNWKVSMDGNGMTIIAADDETKEALKKFNEENPFPENR